MDNTTTTYHPAPADDMPTVNCTGCGEDIYEEETCWIGDEPVCEHCEAAQ